MVIVTPLTNQGVCWDFYGRLRKRSVLFLSTCPIRIWRDLQVVLEPHVSHNDESVAGTTHFYDYEIVVHVRNPRELGPS